LKCRLRPPTLRASRRESQSEPKDHDVPSPGEVVPNQGGGPQVGVHKTARPKALCPHCGQSFLAGRGLTRHLRSCPKKPKASKIRKRKARQQAPSAQTQETQPKKGKEQAPRTG